MPTSRHRWVHAELMIPEPPRYNTDKAGIAAPFGPSLTDSLGGTLAVGPHSAAVLGLVRGLLRRAMAACRPASMTRSGTRFMAAMIALAENGTA
jgi:hypothetical protein